MIGFWLSAILSVARAEYQPLYQNLVDGKYGQFRQQAVAELERETSLARKLEILKAVSEYRSKFYGNAAFTGRVLPFATERCLPVRGQKAVCSSEQGFDFVLSHEESHPVFMIKTKTSSVLSTTARSRTLLTRPELSFGRTIHMIIPEKRPGELYLLIREIEKAPGLGQPVRQTIHVFRLKGASGCKIMEADVSESDGKYALIEEFVHVLGEQISCQKAPVQI